MKADIPDINITAKRMEIINIINDLPRNGEFRKRKLSDITTIAVHHSASKMGQFKPADFARWHMDPKGRLKAPAICYHFAIEPDGAIYQVNTLESVAWHAGNSNGYSIGVELNGNFEIEEPKPEQLHSLRWLVAQLEAKLGKSLALKGHRELPGNATACPGKNMMSRKSEWR